MSRVVLPPDCEAALRAFAAKLAARFGAGLRFVRLFGSWARGQAQEQSDVDVAVVVDGLTRAERDDVVADAVEVGELGHGVALSPYVVSSEHFRVLEQRKRRIALDVMREGVPL